MGTGVSPFTGVSKLSGVTYATGVTIPSGVSDIGGDNATINYNFLSGSLPSGLTFSRASNATYFDSSGILQSATTNTPRFDYNPVTLAPRGLLIEQASTNLILNSGAIGGASWNTASFTIGSNTIVAPDGTTTATTLTGTSSDSSINQQFSAALTNGASYTASVWLKVPSGTLSVNIYLAGVSIFQSKSVLLTTTWQRFDLTGVAFGVSTGTIQIGGGSSIGIGAIIHAWGAQVEQLSFATSYIPTAGATATRARDSLVNSSIPWFNALGGAFTTTWLASHTVPASTVEAASAFSDGTLNNLILLQANGFGGQRCGAQIITGGISQFNELLGSAIVAGTTYKQGISYSAAQNISGLNGLTPVTITAGISLPTVNQLAIGTTVGAAAPFTGWIQSFKYYNKTKTATELQALTF